MKITCQACAAKYTIADDKVQGKIVKIRCKKCGATIVVNGNDPASVGAGGGDQAPASARFDYAGQAGAEQWTVNVADGDQRTMTDAEIAEAYHAGVVNDETFCWKDGMGDWLPLSEIEQLYAQCTSTRVAPPQLGAGAGGAMHDNEEEGVTKIQQPGGGMFGGGGSVSPRPAAGMPAPAANGYAEAAPLAARRTGGRAPVADLFGSAAQAGSEEDVMTSAPAGMPQPHAHDDKLTGQRNENSVLFSLNALTSKGGPGGGAGGGAMPAGSEASGLIDIRQLSNQIGLGEDKKKKSRIDDIMNLGGGGAFAPSLGAPVLAAPPIEEYAPKLEDPAMAGPAAAQGKNKMILFGAIGAGVLLIAGAIGLATMMMHGKDESADKPSSSASAVASGSAAPSASVAAAATDTSAAPSASATASAAPTDSSASAAAPSATATAAATVKPTATAATTAAATGAATTAPTATAAATAAAATAAAATGGSDQPFNMGEAKAKLGAIAGSVQSCKKGDSSGQGRAVITFAPSGMVQSVAVSGTGFEGTPMGACVASRFRGARVPAFSGSPFSVSKSFSIN
jgi:predicted Zn finger-like uncharacterized protein